MELKTFDKNDWEAWAGCEPFANGDDPLISIDRLDKLGALVVDGNLAVFYIFDSVGECIQFTMVHNFKTAASAMRYFSNDSEEVTFKWLVEKGFKFDNDWLL